MLGGKRRLLGLVYLGVAASGLAFLLWAYALRHMETGQPSMFTNMNPLVGVVTTATVLNEALFSFHLAGELLILDPRWDLADDAGTTVGAP